MTNKDYVLPRLPTLAELEARAEEEFSKSNTLQKSKVKSNAKLEIIITYLPLADNNSWTREFEVINPSLKPYEFITHGTFGGDIISNGNRDRAKIIEAEYPNSRLNFFSRNSLFGSSLTIEELRRIFSYDFNEILKIRLLIVKSTKDLHNYVDLIRDGVGIGG